MSSGSWSPERATGFLLERGMFGIEPGVGPMRDLLAALGDPQASLRKIHVVGTNGKSSTARFAAHLAAAAGSRAGAFLSPHLTGFEQRILLPGPAGPVESSAGEFAVAVGTVAVAAEKLEGDWTNGRSLTQFELVTAAAFLQMAEAGVEVGVIEAGMGGRFDATNVLGSGVVALTSVGFDHEAWLGNDLASIAAEKLAVVGKGDVLVVGADPDPAVAGSIADAVAREGVRLVRAPADPGEAIELAAVGSFQRRNFALALAAVVELCGQVPAAAVEQVAASVTVPGRLEPIGTAPDTYVDAAHNPDGIRALAAELVDLAGGRDVVAVVGILADKDASGMFGAMLGRVKSLVVTSAGGPRSIEAAELGRIAVGAGFPEPKVEPDPRRAVESARVLAGADGLVVCTGSIQLVGELVSEPGQRVVTAL